MADHPPPELVDRLARMFHENYERLAPSFGYETRRESAVPWDEVPEQNRSLMRATVAAALAEWADGGLIDPSTWTVVEAKHVADFDWDLDQDTGLAEPFACNWSTDALIGSLNAGAPLVVLSPRGGELERCPAGICRRPAGHAGSHSDLPREGER